MRRVFQGLVAVTRHERFRLGATIVWDIGAGPPMVRRLNVSGSEGLVAAGRPERFRLRANHRLDIGAAPSTRHVGNVCRSVRVWDQPALLSG